TEDPATPRDHGERIAAAVPHSRLQAVDGAHLANWESAEEVNGLLRAHFGGGADYTRTATEKDR
ncbi:alpha/beta fold hydrolase, partial [Streptomonospora algeriensis]